MLNWCYAAQNHSVDLVILSCKYKNNLKLTVVIPWLEIYYWMKIKNQLEPDQQPVII